MRDVGLLRVDTEGRGGVGRPQHRYSLSSEAPSLGLEPSPYPTLARILLRAAAEAGIDHGELADAGREQGRADAAQWNEGTPCLDALTVEQARLGFDPTVVEDDHSAVVAFANCPFRDLATEHPDLVCALHRGLVQGLVDGFSDSRVTRFHSLLDRHPCQVELAHG
jgi:predicted ArsR family transcriptional regulator